MYYRYCKNSIRTVFFKKTNEQPGFMIFFQNPRAEPGHQPVFSKIPLILPGGKAFNSPDF